MRRRDVGRGRRLRPEGNVTSGLGRLKPIRPTPGVFGRGPSDPPAPHYDGAALDGWRRIGRGPARPTGEGRKLDPGRVRHLRPDRRQERRLEA